MVCAVLEEALGDRVFLSVIRRDNVDRVLGELLDRDAAVFLVHPQRPLENFQAVPYELFHSLNLGLVVERSASELLLALQHVDEKEL